MMHPKVWEASGHVATFADPMIDCKGCKARFRADKIFTVRFFDGNGQPVAAEGAEADAPEQAVQMAFNKCNSKTRRRLEDGQPVPCQIEFAVLEEGHQLLPPRGLR